MFEPSEKVLLGDQAKTRRSADPIRNNVPGFRKIDAMMPSSREARYHLR
jgi:hypothetical protein